MRYVWLNIATGEFSNSWDDSEFTDSLETLLDGEISSEWKLIKYECRTDENFNFNDRMKLQ